MRLRLVAVALLVLVSSSVLSAAGREGGRETTSGPPASWRRLFERFDQETGGGWTYEWNPLTGTPHRVSGHFVELRRPPNRDTIEAVARAALVRYRALLLVDPAALVMAEARFDPPVRERVAGTWYVRFHQVHHDLPVRGTVVRLVIRGRRVTMMGADVFPHVAAPTSPTLSAEEATAIVERELAGLPRGDGTPAPPVAPSLGVVPRMEQGRRHDHLAWAVVAPIVLVPRETVLPAATPSVTPRPPDAALLPIRWRYEVDALDGAVLSRENLLSYDTLAGTVTGLVHPSLPSEAAVSMPLAHLSVHVKQNAVDHAAVTNAAGQYTVAGLSAGAASLTAQLSGPSIVVHNKATPDPDTTHTAACTVPGAHDWSFATDDPSPDDVETSAFFHANYIHDWFMRGTPFDLAPATPLSVTVNDGAYCNAHGGPLELAFGDGGGACANTALCADVIYHEYTHAISGTVYGPLINSTLETSSMAEGWSDYFAASATSDPVIGVECGDVRNIDTPDAHYPQDYTGESHKNSIIFSGALWDIRSLGADYADSLAVRALEQGTTTFAEYLAAVLEEDDDPAFSPSPLANADLADGSPNIDVICHSYVDVHGVFHPACAGHTEKPLASITSPVPSALERFDGTAPITVAGTAAGSAVAPLQGFVLEYAVASAPNVWLSAGVALAGGGSADVAQGTLGTIDVAALADGAYALRLTVVDGASQTATATTSFVVDRRIRPGWPQQPGASFFGTPVVAELDPAAPGREIVAVGGNKAYVWHADGTLVPGWPQTVVAYAKASSPAVADLDGDGTPEIVFVDEGGTVRVFHADGTLAAGWAQVCSFLVNTAQATLGDLDGDGHLEVVLAVGSGQVCAWHHDGTAVAGWPVTLPAGVESSIALADLDDDGLPELVIGAADGSLHVLHGDGTAMAGWPQALGEPVGSAPSVADLDGDGTLEIVIATQPGHVYAFHADGSPVAGWPQTVDQNIYAAASVTLADIDGDGLPEVMAMTSTETVHAWKGDGTELPASPLGGKVFYYEQPRVQAAVVGDVDGAAPAVVAVRLPPPLPGNKYYAEVRATHADGTVAAGSPFALRDFTGSGAALADLDGDGHVELVAVSSDGVYVWNLPGSGPDTAAPWPFERHDLRRTGAVTPAAGVALLFDTSGSMSWRHDGTMNVPVAEQRITKAKEATYPFLQLLHDFGSKTSSFGIATFPNHPAQGCQGEVVTPLTLVTDASTQTAIASTVPGLTTANSTPMLAGINAARGLFNSQSSRAIVLLSDGYHNCPTFVDPLDAVFTGLVGQLQADAVRVFTIGFGKPTDVDHPLLEALAEQTTPVSFLGSQFYDVTGPTFDPLNWDPATALNETYKSVLVDALGLQTAADPLGTLTGGQVATRSVHLSEYDRRVSFFLSWVKAQRGRLTLTVRAADGTVVSAAESGVSVHEGETYAIVTVTRAYLAQMGKIGPAPWQLTIAGPGLRPVEKEKYQYSVILDSTVRLDARVGPLAARAGAPLVITARVTAAGHPVTGLQDVWARVARPSDSLGNWMMTPVTPAQLARVPVRSGTEPLPPRQRRALAIADVVGVAPPGYTTEPPIRLVDDGTQGDVQAGDGIYTNTWSVVPHPGSYRFTIAASGHAGGRNAFDRETAMGREVGLEISTPASAISLSHTGPGPALVTVTPRDDVGNFLGPGRSSSFRIVPAVGSMRGALDDLEDGRYRQVLVPPRGVAASEVSLTLETVGPRN